MIYIESIDKKIFMEMDINLFPKSYKKIIKAIGRENLYRIIINYCGITMYMAKPNKLTIIPINNIDSYNIERIRIDQLVDKYRNIAELIGVEFLYRLADVLGGKTFYIAKLKYLIYKAKVKYVLQDIKYIKPQRNLALKYGVTVAFIQIHKNDICK